METVAPNEEDKRKAEEAKEARAFSLKDYELKISHLTNHLTRMWVRFNFFVTIESALLGSRFLIGNGKLTPEVAGLGAALSLIWYVFGAEDRYLMLIYRRQIKNVAEKIGINEHVGQVDDLKFHIQGNPLEWRSSFMSTTRLASLFPLLTLVGWLVTFFLVFNK